MDERLEGFVPITEAGTAVVPPAINGEPMREIGAYAFAGDQRLRAVFLPDTVEKIGAYAFYNCEKLQLVCCFGGIRDLGTGLFTGCKNITRLDVAVKEGERSCLKELLPEIRQTLRVNLCGYERARLIFPEYYEEAVENTPARILVTHTHGCGHRYRYSVTREGVKFREYDSVFPHIQVQEPEDLVTELVLGRLRYPCGLSAEAKAAYEEYLLGHLDTAVRVILSGRDPLEQNLDEAVRGGAAGFAEPEDRLGQLRWLAGEYGRGREDLRAMTDTAGQMGEVEALGILMDLAGSRFTPDRRRFDL